MLNKRILSIPIWLWAVVFLLLALGFAIGPVGKSVLSRIGVDVTFPDWLSIPRPAPRLPAEAVFHIFGFPITNSVLGAWFTVAVLTVLSYMVTRKMKLVPGRLQIAFESLVGWVYDFCKRVAGEKNGRRFFPVVATIFLFVSFNAWLSLMPGFGSITIATGEGHPAHLLRGANTDINMPLALAVISFVIVWYFGLKALGIKFLSQFFNVGPLLSSLAQILSGKVKAGLNGLVTGAIMVFVGLLELLSQFIRILSFTFRLFGNMTAGEILLISAAFLLPYVVELPFYILELLVGLVQALIFSGLTLVFLTLAVAGHGEASEAHH